MYMGRVRVSKNMVSIKVKESIFLVFLYIYYFSNLFSSILCAMLC